MNSLVLHEWHQTLNATFIDLNGSEIVESYGDVLAEHFALTAAAGVLDLSCRGRICLVGNDRKKFLNGQVTNDVNKLNVGEGCYAALITAKGKMQADLEIYCLENELLLDFEPGLATALAQRLDKYVIADDVQIVDVAPHYGLLSVQGPKAVEALLAAELDVAIPERDLSFSTKTDPQLGDIYVMNHARTGSCGFDCFVPINALETIAGRLLAAAKQVGGRACGWRALEIARIEAAIPRFGQDMDETNLPPEAGIESRAISYTKGCYIGQEIIARIRTYGQVAKALRVLRLGGQLESLPSKGDKLLRDGKEVGYITSAIHSPRLNANVALGYVRREANQPGTELTLRSSGSDSTATVIGLPFQTPVPS